MKLLLKQKMWSWFDSFDIWDEQGEVVYKVKGHLSWGHAFKIYDKNDVELAEIKQEVWSWTYKFNIIENGINVGIVHKQIHWFTPKFDIKYHNKSYDVDGNWMQWDYRVCRDNKIIADIHKEIWNWTDTYSITVKDEDAFAAVVLVVAIDAIKCSQNN